MATVTLLPSSRGVPNPLTISEHEVYRGGEGSIFLSSDGRYVVKLYHRPPPDKQKLLEHILVLGRNLGDDERFLAWPLAIVDKVNDRPRVGVVTQRVPPAYVPLYKLVYSPIDAAQQFREGRSWLEYLKIARSVAAAVRIVHGKGMAHADLHLKNFLADPRSGEAVLIDLDGLVVKGFLPPQVKGMPGFIAPEILTGAALPEASTDRYSLAVLVLWVLLFRNVMQPRICYDPDDEKRDDELGYGQYACFSEHPQDRRNWFPQIGVPLFRGGALSYRALTPRVQALTEQALIEGLHQPSKRPQAVEWERALAEAYDVLVTCAVCRQSFFYQYWLQPERRRCPFCGSPCQEPLPAVLELLEPRARGTYVPARTLAVYHGLPIFADIAEPGELPPFSRRGTPIIAEVVWASKERVYRLVNCSGVPWQLIGQNCRAVASGTSVALRRGVLLSFGEGKRLLRVVG